MTMISIALVSLLLSTFLVQSSEALTPVVPVTRGPISFSSALQQSSISTDSTTTAKEQLLQTAQQLKDEYGIFLFEKSAKEQLNRVLEVVEKGAVDKPIYNADQFRGEWELIVTTASNNDGVEIPTFLNQGPLKAIRDSIRTTANKYIKIQQLIQGPAGSTDVDRIDHIIEYDPPSVLQDVISNLPEQLTSLNINPFQVSKSQLILQHKAVVESLTDPFLTKLNLYQISLTVAGTSTILDPNGKEIAALPIPFGEFLNAGDFVTTYIDDSIRISRGKQGLLDQVRVFVRTDTPATGSTKPYNKEEDALPIIDPEFDSDIESPSDVEVL